MAAIRNDETDAVVREGLLLFKKDFQERFSREIEKRVLSSEGRLINVINKI